MADLIPLSWSAPEHAFRLQAKTPRLRAQQETVSQGVMAHSADHESHVTDAKLFQLLHNRANGLSL